MSHLDYTGHSCREGGICDLSPMKVQLDGPLPGVASIQNFPSVFRPPPGLEHAALISPPPGLENERLLSTPPLEPEKMSQCKLPPINRAMPVNRPPGVFAAKGGPVGSSIPRLQRAAYGNGAQSHHAVQASRRCAAMALKRNRGPQPPDDAQPATSSYAEILLVIRRAGSESQLTLQDVMPYILRLAKDKDGVEFLVARLDDSNQSVKAICQAVLTETSKLAVDPCGHILISKLLEVAAKEQQWALAVHLVRCAKQLTCDVHGCRVIQTALRQVSADLQVELAYGLKESIVHCMRNIHGNHVVQLCVEQLKPESVAFITDAINAWGAEKASVHPYACRVVMRLLEYCQTQQQLQEMCDSILSNIQMLAMNRYGNYVVQHILEHGKPQHKQQVTMGCIAVGISELAKHKYAHNVVEKCFEADKSPVVNALLSSPLEDLISDRFGCMVLQHMLNLSTGATHELLLQRLLAVKPQLADSQAATPLLGMIDPESAVHSEQEREF
mmetsp:Transcript_61505/g.106965  ORF Transcript_61505/g.106965 Transcript_61505/m.106965 type:complete len:500 (-) Transcript_61505:220-1719(-)